MVAMSWPVTMRELAALQDELARLATQAAPWIPAGGSVSTAAGFIAYPAGLTGSGQQGDAAWAAAVGMAEGRRIAAVVFKGEAGGPYAPGYLALREGALLAEALRRLQVAPDVILVNATGRDHPRRAGLALHLGVALDLPSLGVTDRPLLATGPEPGPERGASAPLRLDGDVVGFRLRTLAGARAVVVHAGWRVTAETACALVLTVTAGARTPEPLRQARQLARTQRSQQEGSP